MDWLDELDQMRREDLEKQKAEAAQLDLSVLQKNSVLLASEALKQSEAHKLLRRVQSVLLSGKGTIEVFDRSGEYDKALALVWQGPISKARSPRPEDPEPYRYILVGARGKRLYVNDKQLEQVTPEALKTALVWAAKNPLLQKK